MQIKAEEKKKGYACVVWVERSISSKDIENLESWIGSIGKVDEEMNPCLHVRH